MTAILNLPLVERDVETYQNADAILYFRFEGFDPLVPAAPSEQVLTGITFALALRRVAEDSTVHLAASSEDGRMTIAGDGSTVLKIVIDDSVMAGVHPGSYVYDIRAQGDGKTLIVAKGAWLHGPGVTRAA